MILSHVCFADFSLRLITCVLNESVEGRVHWLCWCWVGVMPCAVKNKGEK